MTGAWIIYLYLTCVVEILGQTKVIQEIRLANGPNSTSGRVELKVDDEWGTVCDDHWDDLDASVACKMLNYRNGGKAVVRAGFGQGVGKIHLDDVSCDGSEERLDECLMAVTADCLHEEDAGVVCDPTAPVGGPTTRAPTTQIPATPAPVPDNCSPTNPAVGVRLVGFNEGIGLVEVNNGGVWGMVCDDNFDENAAKVVCRSLCFDPVFARAGAPAGTTRVTNNAIILDDVQCNGNEARLQDCNHAAWNTHDCSTTTEVAAVTCVDLNSQPPSPPVPVLECRDGYLIAAFSKRRDPNLERKHLTIANPIVGSCNAQFSEDDNTVVVRIPFSECGTIVTYNSTHLIYENVIKYDHTRLEGAITRVNIFMVEVYCQMPRRDEVTRPVEPQTQVVTQKSTGRFIVTMSFYLNNSFTNPASEVPLRIPLGEWLNVGLSLQSVDSRLKLVVPNCVATPSTDINDPVNFTLFQNSCPEEPTLALFNINQTRVGYRYESFMFVNFDTVYLHCGAFVCLLSDGSAECDRSCRNAKPKATTNGRRRRDAPPEQVTINSGPMIVSRSDNSMTVQGRIIRHQKWTKTVSFPDETPAHTPGTTVRVGTSFRVSHHDRTTTANGITTSSQKEGSLTSFVPMRTTSESTLRVTTSKGTVTTSEASTTASNDLITSSVKHSTISLHDSRTVYKDTVKPTPPVLLQNEGEPDKNILRGYVPDLVSSSGRPLIYRSALVINVGLFLSISTHFFK